MDETKTETVPHNGERIQPRRSSRSTLSGSPTTKEERNGAQPESTTSPTSPSSTTSTDTSLQHTNGRNNTITAAAMTTAATGTGASASSSSTATANTANQYSRVTRSISTESNSNEESPNINTTKVNRKRRRNTSTARSSNKKQRSTVAGTSTTSTTTAIKGLPRGTGDDYERETRNTAIRLSKEAKDAKMATRETSIKRKLDELDTLEQNVKDQSHDEYQKLLQEIQTKRAKRLKTSQGKHALMDSNLKNGFFAQKKSANDKYYLEKSVLRQKMIKQVQKKINAIEQEYYFFQHDVKTSLDSQHFADWTPPDRPSMISSLTLGLNEQEIAQDFAELQDLAPS